MQMTAFGKLNIFFINKMTVLLTAHNEKERETSKTFIMGEIIVVQ